MTRANDVWVFPMPLPLPCPRRGNRNRLRNGDHQYYRPRNTREREWEREREKKINDLQGMERYTCEYSSKEKTHGNNYLSNDSHIFFFMIFHPIRDFLCEDLCHHFSILHHCSVEMSNYYWLTLIVVLFLLRSYLECSFDNQCVIFVKFYIDSINRRRWKEIIACVLILINVCKRRRKARV